MRQADERGEGGVNAVVKFVSLNLPDNPGRLPTTELAGACQRIFAQRDELVGQIDVAAALEALQRTGAIERYVRTREHKDSARRAARVLETAVGAALPDAEGEKGGRGKKASHTCEGLSKDDCLRFRLMAKHRAVWWPQLVERALSRRQALAFIDVDRKPQREHKTQSMTDLEALPAETFGCIYADPPWNYGNQGTRAAQGGHYNGMSVEDICKLPVARLPLPNAHLHLWTTNAFLFEARQVLEAWGFTYKSCFVWVKPQMGIGNYWRVSHEFLLLGVRGALSFSNKGLKSWGEFKRGRHSAKPERVRDLIQRASPGEYLEMFARRPVTGWWTWGNEIERDLLSP